MFVSRKTLLALAAVGLAAVTAGCGGSSAPKVTSPDDALYWINDYMPTGYSLWNDNGNPVGSTSSCTDANGYWIAGCQAFYYVNARPLQGPSDSEWSFWQADAVNDYGDGNPRVRTQCFGIIPPYDDYGTQLYETSCTNVGRPPGS